MQAYYLSRLPRSKAAKKREGRQLALWLLLAVLGLGALGSVLGCTRATYHGQANAKPRAIGLTTPEPAAPRVSTVLL